MAIPKKCAIYCRVSTSDQDISTQLEKLPKYAESKGWEVFDTYIDEGISGTTIDARPGFRRLLDDMINQKFNILLVEAQDRITRTENLAERGLILQKIKENNIAFWSLAEGRCDLSDFAGEITSTIKFIIAAEERKNIARRTLKGKKAGLKNGNPRATGGNLPFARTYDKATGKWSLDETKAKFIRMTAKRYLKGESLRNLADELKEKHQVKISYDTLIKVFKNRSGDTWTIRLKDGTSQTFKVPRILDDDTIEKVRERLKFNRTFNRHDIQKFVLNGFVRCGECHRALTGQESSTNPGFKKYRYRYYRHPNIRFCDCQAFSSISAKKLEDAVFTTIFENVDDQVGFEKAVKDSLPDSKMINYLDTEIKKSKNKLKKVRVDLAKLIEFVLDGTLQKETVAEKESELTRMKKLLENDIAEKQSKLDSLPDLEKTQKEADRIRMGLLDYFGTVEAFKKHGYKHKREFLHWLFDGLDEDGLSYGIYLTKRKQGWDYTISAKMFCGTMTITKKGIDYPDHNMPDEVFKTKGQCPDTGDAAERLQGCCKGRHETIQNPPGRA